MNKRLKFFLFFVSILTIAVYYVTNYILPYSIIKPYRVVTNDHPENYELNAKAVSIYTKDSLQLAAYHITPSIPPKATIILIHGISGCKEHFLPLSKTLTKAGYAIVAIDNRAHGKSEGLYCTYGYYEKSDIAQVVSYLKSHGHNEPIGVWGNSLGGAIAIQAMAYDPRISFGIIESTFTTLDDIVYDYQKRLSKGIGLKPIAAAALAKAGEIADFNPNQVSPLNAIKQLKQPIFIAHGDADKNIAVHYGKTLYENAASVNKELCIVNGAGHYDLFTVGKKNYKDRIFSFIEKNLP